ncbi:unnamed protein product [Ectocarpus sp. CCAP 1310/34]|nr:unnamed protein product [Ectocarpus sp. CCAP 1310/34]
MMTRHVITLSCQRTKKQLLRTSIQD